MGSSGSPANGGRTVRAHRPIVGYEGLGSILYPGWAPHQTLVVGRCGENARVCRRPPNGKRLPTLSRRQQYPHHVATIMGGIMQGLDRGNRGGGRSFCENSPWKTFVPGTILRCPDTPDRHYRYDIWMVSRAVVRGRAGVPLQAQCPVNEDRRCQQPSSPQRWGEAARVSLREGLLTPFSCWPRPSSVSAPAAVCNDA